MSRSRFSRRRRRGAALPRPAAPAVELPNPPFVCWRCQNGRHGECVMAHCTCCRGVNHPYHPENPRRGQ